jgi:hypothetical protein
MSPSTNAPLRPGTGSLRLINPAGMITEWSWVIPAGVTHPVGAKPTPVDMYIQGQSVKATWDGQNLVFTHGSMWIIREDPVRVPVKFTSSSYSAVPSGAQNYIQWFFGTYAPSGRPWFGSLTQIG